MINRITEREECIRAHCNTSSSTHELILFGLSQGLGDGRELSLPPQLLFGSKITLNVSDTGIDSVLAFHTLFELKSKDFGMLAQIPGANLAPSELYAVDATLLPCTNANHHTIVGKADGVTLSVLYADRGNNHITNRSFGQILLGGDSLLHVVLGNDHVIPLLREGHSVDLAVLDGTGVISRDSLKDNKLATFLLLENLKSSRSVTGCDNAIADLLL
mmetsp:Transcript_35027/g.76629  ORF Transcript_35027/g.76629 Transcript_35027/m.76629 type:complete len:217 (-) Transcript_35027:1216-1866(-)